jgi:hypothetical protein
MVGVLRGGKSRIPPLSEFGQTTGQIDCTFILLQLHTNFAPILATSIFSLRKSGGRPPRTLTRNPRLMTMRRMPNQKPKRTRKMPGRCTSQPARRTAFRRA